MSLGDLAAWTSVCIGLASLIVALLSLRKSKENEEKLSLLESKIVQSTQTAQAPIYFASGGGGGGGSGTYGGVGGVGGAGGGLIVQNSQQSRND